MQATSIKQYILYGICTVARQPGPLRPATSPQCAPCLVSAAQCLVTACWRGAICSPIACLNLPNPRVKRYHGKNY